MIGLYTGGASCALCGRPATRLHSEAGVPRNTYCGKHSLDVLSARRPTQ